MFPYTITLSDIESEQFTREEFIMFFISLVVAAIIAAFIAILLAIKGKI